MSDCKGCDKYHVSCGDEVECLEGRIAELEAGVRLHVANGIALDKENAKLREAGPLILRDICEAEEASHEDHRTVLINYESLCDIVNSALLPTEQESE